MRYARSLMILVSSMLLIPAYSAHSAEIELPKIGSTCRPNRSLSLPIPAPPSELFLVPSLRGGAIYDRKTLETLIAARQWDQALVEFQDLPEWGQSEMLRPLLIALVKANEVQRASQFLVQQYPARSKMRAEGMGTIAAELTKRDRFESAIEVLKTVPQDSEYQQNAVIPVIEILTARNQIGKIADLIPLFPNEDARSSFWYATARRIAFQPEQAKQLAGLIENSDLRSSVIERMANFWLRRDGNAALNGWKIATEIEDCASRLTFFLNAFDRLKQSGLKPSNVARSLDELEALLNARDASSSYKRLDQRLTLARLNLEQGRKAQAEKLITQVTQAMKAEFPSSRATLLVELAKQYRQLGKTTIALQMLDSAVITANEAMKPQTTRVNGMTVPMLIPPIEWKEELLRDIAKQYRSLNQPQKASAIERTIPKQPRYALPEIKPIPSVPLPAPTRPILIPRR